MSTCIAVRRHQDAVRPLRLSGAAADHPNKHSINTNAERVPFFAAEDAPDRVGEEIRAFLT